MGFDTSNTANYGNLHNKHNVIVNLDNKGSGSHWASVTDTKKHKNTYLYQDSFGVQADNLGLKNSLIFYNNQVKQDPSQENCGYLAMKSFFN